MNEELMARDGHPSMLLLDRYDLGELEGATRHGLELHVEGCAHCRARLHAIAHPEHVPMPRIIGRSTGSATIAYLVASTAVAIAAGLVLVLGAPIWPSPHTARQGASEPYVASAYTSVASDGVDGSGLELELSSTRNSGGELLTATPGGEGWLAVVSVAGDLDAELDEIGDTGCDVEPEIVSVLAPPRAVTESLVVQLPKRSATRHTVVLLCPTQFTVDEGDVLAPDPGCIARMHPSSHPPQP
jgi:hypothetical protein